MRARQRLSGADAGAVLAGPVHPRRRDQRALRRVRAAAALRGGDSAGAASATRPASSARRSRPRSATEPAGMRLRSKLPDVGTTIFTVMSRRARELGAHQSRPGLSRLRHRSAARGAHGRGDAPGSQPVRADGRRAGAARAHRRASWPRATAASSIRSARSPSPSAPPRRSIRPCRRWSGRARRPSSSIRRTTPTSRRCDWRAARCMRLPLLPPDFRYDWDRVRSARQRPHAADHRSTRRTIPRCTAATAADLDALAELDPRARHRRALR